MKTRAAKLMLAFAVLAVAGCLVVPAMRAGESKKDGATEKKRERNDDDIRKYDKNANGKLDPDEEAEMRADRAKERERKKKG